MNILKRMIFALLLLNSANLFAAPNTTVSGNVVFFSQWPTGLLIQLDSNNASNPAACTYAGYYFINTLADPSVENSSDSYISANKNYSFMKLVLFAAKMNSQRVELVISGAGCELDRPKIVAARIL